MNGLLADISPRVLGLAPATWVALVVAAGLGLVVWLVMKPVRQWRRFAARHGLTLANDRMSGTQDGLEIVVELVRTDGAPHTRVSVRGARTFEREGVGRMSERDLEQALADGLSAAKG